MTGCKGNTATTTVGVPMNKEEWIESHTPTLQVVGRCTDVLDPVIYQYLDMASVLFDDHHTKIHFKVY